MKYKVAWSGGLDSTFLVWKLLSQGHSVDAVYLKVHNNKEQAERELKAIGEMTLLFSRGGKPFTFRGVGVEITVNHSVFSELQQVPVWLFGLLCDSELHSYDRVALAYVLNDCAVSYLDEIQRTWDSYRGFSSSWESEGRSLPDIEFPLIKVSKSYIANALPFEFLKHVTFCESDTDLCGMCPSCKRWKDLENSHHIPDSIRRFEPKVVELDIREKSMSNGNPKTEHSGAKKGRGAFWGRKVEAKSKSKKVRRKNGKKDLRKAKDDLDKNPPEV